jgi:drug/metabolite transporter (DMT)-like permease
MTALQVASSALILIGVALALAPGAKEIIPAGHRIAGFGFGLLAAAGQAWGAVLSRYAFQRAHAIGLSIDGITAAYQRIWGGVLSLGLLLLLGAMHGRWRPSSAEAPQRAWRKAWPWVLANAVAGPALGVSCYQWALKSAPSSVVLSIVATTPLTAMFLAFVVEGALPARRAIFGSFLAVAGVIFLLRNS